MYRSICVILLAVGCLSLNVYSFTTHTFSALQRSHLPYYEPGYQFLEFRPFLKDVSTIGYMTEKDLSREGNDGVYLQAQYFLAPAIVELTHDKQFVILDIGLDPMQIVIAMQRLNGKRLVSTEYGQALILRK